VIKGVPRAILYLSRTLQPAEKKWVIRELDALGILWNFILFYILLETILSILEN